MLRLMLFVHALTRHRVVRRVAASGQMPRGEPVDRPVSVTMIIIIARSMTMTMTALFPLIVQRDETCQSAREGRLVLPRRAFCRAATYNAYGNDSSRGYL